MSLQRPDEYERETYEFIPVIDVAVDGEPVTDFEIAVPRIWERPEEDDFLAAVDLSGKKGFILDGTEMGVGTFDVYVRVTDSPEIPVFRVGRVRII